MNNKRKKFFGAFACQEDLSSRPLYVWGTGNTADLYQEGFVRLEREDILIVGHIDNVEPFVPRDELSEWAVGQEN